MIMTPEEREAKIQYRMRDTVPPAQWGTPSAMQRARTAAESYLDTAHGYGYLRALQGDS
jgi:hypothetical protein